MDKLVFITLIFLWLIFQGDPDLFDIFKTWVMHQAGMR